MFPAAAGRRQEQQEAGAKAGEPREGTSATDGKDSRTEKWTGLAERSERSAGTISFVWSTAVRQGERSRTAKEAGAGTEIASGRMEGSDSDMRGLTEGGRAEKVVKDTAEKAAAMGTVGRAARGMAETAGKDTDGQTERHTAAVLARDRVAVRRGTAERGMPGRRGRKVVWDRVVGRALDHRAQEKGKRAWSAGKQDGMGGRGRNEGDILVAGGRRASTEGTAVRDAIQDGMGRGRLWRFAAELRGVATAVGRAAIQAGTPAASCQIQRMTAMLQNQIYPTPMRRAYVVLRERLVAQFARSHFRGRLAAPSGHSRGVYHRVHTDLYHSHIPRMQVFFSFFVL